MNNILNQLIELQKIDSRLLEIDEIKGDLPQKVVNNKEMVKELIINIDSNSDEVLNTEKEIRELTSRIDDSNNKLKKYKDQLYLVSSNKEYDALMSEIDQLKDFLNGVENKILSLEELKEQLNENIKLDKIKTDSCKKELENNQIELTDAMSNSEVEENNLCHKRKGIVTKIDNQYIVNYEKLRSARDGIAVASIYKNSCGGCYNNLPAQLVIEIKENNKIIICTSCGVYLYWENK